MWSHERAGDALSHGNEHSLNMLQVWKESYTRRPRLASATVFSAAIHTVLIAAWIVGTQPAAGVDRESIANRVFYIPPPNRPPLVRGPRETVQYIAMNPDLGAAPVRHLSDAHVPVTPVDQASAGGTHATDTTGTSEPPGNNDVKTDSVFSEIEVDTAVVRSQASAAPAYPLDLLKNHIEGSVVARYVVDTTGFVDVSTFEVVSATDSEFVDAIRDVLPYMRFSPAKIGGRKVRQLVEQPFGFRIAADVIAPAAATKKKPR